jgi:hypothetical protein
MFPALRVELVHAAEPVLLHYPQACPGHVHGVGHPVRNHGGRFLQAAMKYAWVRGDFGDDGLLPFDAQQCFAQRVFGPVPIGDLALQLPDFLLQHGVVAFSSRRFAKPHDLVAQRCGAGLLRLLLHR